MANKKCIIFTSCPNFDAEAIKKRIPQNAYVICADGGYKNAIAAGLACDLLVGDRDSLGDISAECEEIRVSSIKDDTDLMLGIKKAADMGFDDICIADSLTGRFDHVLANIQSLYYIASLGLKGKIISPETELFFLRGGEKTVISADECRFFSVLAYNGTAEGVNIRNAAYELEDGTLTCGFPLGVSNEPIETPAQISIGSGNVIIIKIK